jgi:hypothetical protein
MEYVAIVSIGSQTGGQLASQNDGSLQSIGQFVYDCPKLLVIWGHDCSPESTVPALRI